MKLGSLSVEICGVSFTLTTLDLTKNMSSSKGKLGTGGEPAVRTNLGEITSFMPSFFFLFFSYFHMGCFHPDFGFRPQFWKKNTGSKLGPCAPSLGYFVDNSLSRIM